MSHEARELETSCRNSRQGWCLPLNLPQTYYVNPLSSQALAKNENNYKALFRKGKALGEQGFFEKAVKILEDLKTKNPNG